LKVKLDENLPKSLVDIFKQHGHATLARADVIVSWNFKHLVNPSRVKAFSGVNVAQGYGPVIIMTPSDINGVLEETDEE
jgi:hypothetical protein